MTDFHHSDTNHIVTVSSIWVKISNYFSETERQRDRERETERDRDRERQRQRETETETETERVNLYCCNKGAIQGMFLLFKRVFNIDL